MANTQALLSSTFLSSIPQSPVDAGVPNPPSGIAGPAPAPLSGSTTAQAVSGAVSPSAVPSVASTPLPTLAASPSDGWSQAPIIIGAVLGGAVLIALIFLGCLAIYRRRQWQLRNRDIPSMSETETLLSRRSIESSNVAPKYDKRFDIENPAPVHLAKNQGRQMFPHLKTLHLLSRSVSTTSSSSTLTNGSNNGKRVYTTQPPIPTVSVTYEKASGTRNSMGSTHAPSEHRSSLPDGFESFIYSLRSPQFIEGTIAKRLSLVSNISAIRFARDSQAWGAKRASNGSFATVFDDGQQKETSSPPALTPESRRVSQKPRIRPPLLSQSNVPGTSQEIYEDIAEEVDYQPTPLAPPPAQIRSRSVTPTNFVVRRTASIESADTLVGAVMAQNSKSTVKEPVQEGPSMPLRPGTNILHSAVAKGKISRQEAESALGMRIALTP